MIYYQEVLSPERLKILPNLKNFKDKFYLAGGTGLALQIGHRESEDFDFFTSESFDTEKLFEFVKKSFEGSYLDITQEERSTLSLLLNKKVKISFMEYKYPMLKSMLEEPFLKIASMEDIAAMKFSAITARSAYKDYVDLFYILKHISLLKLLELSEKKLPSLDRNLILKSISYFGDIQKEKIQFKPGFEVTEDEVERHIKNEVLALSRS